MTGIGLTAAQDLPIPRRPGGVTEVPLSAFQQRMWFLCTSYEGASSPVVYLSHRLRGPLDTEALARAVRLVVDRHESLRAVVDRREHGPVLVITPPGRHTVERVALDHLPPDVREERLTELLAARTGMLFPLDGEELITSCLIRLADDEHVLSIVVHHLVADGASSGILSAELSACYGALVRGEEPSLPPLAVGYGDFARWQQSGLDERARDGLNYWRERLAGLAPLELPTDGPRPAFKGTRGADLVHLIGADLLAGVEALARSARCSTFTVLLMAYQALLARRSGQDDVCVGIPVAGRGRIELEPMIGLFGNTLPMRGDLGGDPTFRELLRRGRSMVLGALSRQDVPFGHVVAQLDLPDDPSRTQVFQTIAVLHTEAGGELELAGLTVSGLPAGMPQIIHDLVLDMWQRPTGLETVWRYDTALFGAATVAGLAGAFEEVLRRVVADPESRLSTLPGAPER